MNDEIAQGAGEELMALTPPELARRSTRISTRDRTSSSTAARAISRSRRSSASRRGTRTIVERAHARGKMVETHATSREGLRLALDAGIDGIQHPEMVDGAEIPTTRTPNRAEEIVCSMLVSTITGEAWEKHLKDRAEAQKKQTKADKKVSAARTTFEDRQRANDLGIGLEVRRSNAQKLIKAGALVTSAPTATGRRRASCRGSPSRESGSRHRHDHGIEGLVELGMTPAQAIVAGTKNGADRGARSRGVRHDRDRQARGPRRPRRRPARRHPQHPQGRAGRPGWEADRSRIAANDPRADAGAVVALTGSLTSGRRTHDAGDHDSDRDALFVETTDGIATVTLNRPRQFNALSSALIEELQGALDRIAADSTVRVVSPGRQRPRLLFAARPQGDPRDERSARGRVVVRAMQPHDDDHHIAAAADHREGARHRDGRGCQLVARAIWRWPRPTRSLRRRASTSARSVRRRAWRSAAPSDASRDGDAADGEMIDASRAREIGLVNRVVAPEALDGEVDALARLVASKSPTAIATGKRVFYRQLEQSLSDGVHAGGTRDCLRFFTDDGKEGVDAFLERRPAVEAETLASVATTAAPCES
jgi:hypothetical protein